MSLFDFSYQFISDHYRGIPKFDDPEIGAVGVSCHARDRRTKFRHFRLTFSPFEILSWLQPWPLCLY